MLGAGCTSPSKPTQTEPSQREPLASQGRPWPHCETDILDVSMGGAYDWERLAASMWSGKRREQSKTEEPD